MSHKIARLDYEMVYKDKHDLENDLSTFLNEFMAERWGMYMLKGIDVEVYFNPNENHKPEVNARLRIELR